MIHVSSRIPQSKLLCPTPGIWELERPRLIERLNEGRTAPLSIICGMAGSGKTTLARQWATQLEQPFAWITLDESDNELGRFVLLLVEAVRTVSPEFGSATLGDLGYGAQLTAGDLALSFRDEIAAMDEAVIVVIDELQVLSSTAIFDFLIQVFRLPLPNLHLCLVGRTDPPLPLGNYRAHYHLTEIRIAQLLLTLDETNEFLVEIAHAPLTSAAVRRLHAETEGWIAGLHLTALALRDEREDPDASVLYQRANIDSMEFLVNEVIERAPPSLQRRMLLLAIPERINAELSWHLLHTSPDAASFDVEALLVDLEASGYFLVSLGEDRTWYRFHPLFRAALIDTTTRRFGPDTISDGHRLAAEWFAANNFVDQAIRHFLAIGDFDRAADLVEEHAQHALATDNWLMLEWWLNELPASVRSSRLELVLAQAWIHQLRGTHSEIPALVLSATSLAASNHALSEADRSAIDLEIELLRAINPPPRVDSSYLQSIGQRAWKPMVDRNRMGTAYAFFYLLLGAVEENRFDDASLEFEAIANSFSGEGSLFSKRAGIWALTFAALLRLWHGELDDAWSHGQRLLATSTDLGFSRSTAEAHTLLGSVRLQRNALEEAAQHFGVTVGEPATGILYKREALYDLARIASMLGDDAEADRIVSRLFDLHYSVKWMFGIPSVRALQAEVALLRGDRKTAIAWAESAAVDAEQDGLASVVVPALIKARILVSEPMRSTGNLREADELLAVLARRLETQHVHRLWIAVRTLQAVVLDLTGANLKALRLLDDTIAAAKGHIRPFLDQSPHVSALLEQLVQRDGRSGMRAVLLDASRADANRRSFTRPLISRRPPASVRMRASRNSRRGNGKSSDFSPSGIRTKRLPMSSESRR